MIANNNFICFSDIYSELKTKTSNKLRYQTYFDLLFNTLLEMFTYNDLPDSIPQRFLETILHTRGEVFIAKIKDELYATVGTLSGEVDAYGLGTDAIAVCPIGEAQGKRDIDIVYGINNDTATPDTLTYWTSHLLGETDKSVKLNVLYSRLLNIPKVRDEKDKNAFKEIISKLIDGEVEAFASSNILDLELADNGSNVFQITDPNKIDKIQYLSRFKDDILKTFYNFYGQAVQTQNKSAQSISDELHGMDSVSFIIPIQMLKCRQKMCDDINRIFGLNVSVDFSESWKLEYKALENRDLNENGIADVAEDASNSLKLSENDNRIDGSTLESETGVNGTESKVIEGDTLESELEQIEETLDEIEENLVNDKGGEE